LEKSMSAHAIASPSGADKWLNCANSLAAELGQPDTAGEAAELGTAKHELLCTCLKKYRDPSLFIGTYANEILIDSNFADDVRIVLHAVMDRVREYESLGYRVEIDIEQALPIGHITGEKGARGTGDIVLRCYWRSGNFVEVIDAKFGWVPVDPWAPQLKMYGLGALEKFSLFDDFDFVSFAIAQPSVSENLVEAPTVPVYELEKWGEKVAGPAAKKALAIRKSFSEGVPLLFENYKVTEKGCIRCKAAALCPARIKHVQDTVGADFETLEEGEINANLILIENLGDIFQKLDGIEDWIKAVRLRVEAELLSGAAIPGLKLVTGRKGNRAWASEQEARDLMAEIGLTFEQMYVKKLRGPKPILDLLEGSPDKVALLEPLISRSDGKPHVALASDKRAALEIKPAFDGFETLD
jgi:hypothetical protein